jgi:hypothetical protein
MSSKSLNKPTHGGPRKGAGRPQGKKSANAKGRTAVTRSVSMQPESWDKLDRLRGTMSRGKFIESMLPAGGGGKQYEVVCDIQKGEIHLLELKSGNSG